MTVKLGTIEEHQTRMQSSPGDIEVEKIDQHCTVNLESTGGAVRILQKVDQHCNVVIKAKEGVFIGQKFDQHCNVIITAGGAVNIGQKIDGNSWAFITAGGPITIGQKIDGNSTATLISPQSISVGQKVDGNSLVEYSAPHVGWGTEGVKGGARVIALLNPVMLATFNGTAHFESSLASGDSPVKMVMKVSGAPGARHTGLMSFNELELMSKIGPVTVDAFYNGDGQFNPATGAITLPAKIHAEVNLGGFPIGVDAPVTFTTGKTSSPDGHFHPQGTPLKGDGSVVLVAAGVVDVPLEGKVDFSLTLTGKFAPLPQ